MNLLRPNTLFLKPDARHSHQASNHFVGFNKMVVSGESP